MKNLHYLIYNPGSLPINLIKFLLKFINKEYNPVTEPGIKNLVLFNQNCIESIKSKKEKKFIKKYKLCAILPYKNQNSFSSSRFTGSSAWYSFKDHMVYDFINELGTFNKLVRDKKVRKKLRKPVRFSQWMREVHNKERESVWLNETN